MSQLETIQAPVREDLEQFNALFSSSLSTGDGLLGVALKHLCQRSGKQMRPLLLLLTAKACGEVTMKCQHAACALEMLHLASLIHDDVVDESDMRRGVKSVNALMGNQVAVLVGDFLFSKALEHAVMTRSMRVMRIVSILGQTLAKGELEQIDNLSSDEISESAYFSVIRRKTASLFSACAELGALLSGGDKGDVTRMRGIGTLIGICFQLRDDILDYTGQESGGKETMGKPVGHDLHEGKLTLPVIHLAMMHPEYRDMILSVRRGKANEEQITELVRLVMEGEGIAYSEKTMDDFCNMTNGLISDIKEKNLQETFRSYVSFVAGRKW